MSRQGTKRTHAPRRASENDSSFGALRRLYYRNERGLLAGWLLLLLCLNSLPRVWSTLDANWSIEARIIEERESRWSLPLRAALTLARKGKNVEAIALFEKTLAVMPALQIHHRTGRLRLEATTELAGLYLEAGRPKRARRLLREVVESDPRDYRAQTLYGHALWELGKIDRALVHYQTSLDMRPVQLDVVKQLVGRSLEKTQYHRAIESIEQYLDAPFASKGAIYFSERYVDLDASRDVVRFPVILDGRPHTYKIFTNSNRNRGADRFASAAAIRGLRIVPALVDHVIARIESVAVYREGDAAAPNPVLLRDERLELWQPLGHLDILGGGLTHSPRTLASLKNEVDIPDPKRVTHVEVRMSLQRPIDRDFLAMMEMAYRNTLQRERGLALARSLVPYDGLDNRIRAERLAANDQARQKLAALESSTRP